MLTPRRLPLPPGVQPACVAAGGAHTLVAAQGVVFACGLNDFGQLGREPGDSASTLQTVYGLPDVVAVSAGAFHSLALSAAGELWAFGRNSDGQCGVGAPSRSVPPTRVELGEAVTAVAAGSRHSLALGASGALYGFGANELVGAAPSKTGWRLSPPRAQAVPLLVRALRGVRVVCVAAGSSHSALVDADGALYTFGSGAFQQLGTGANQSPEPARVPGLPAVAHVACGGLHTLAVSYGGEVWAWGANEHGCLGQGLKAPAARSAPARVSDVTLREVSAGWKHSCGVSAAGELFSWGWGGTSGSGEDSSGGQLGLDDEFDFWEPQAVALPPGTRCTSVSAGFNHTCGIFTAGLDDDDAAAA